MPIPAFDLVIGGVGCNELHADSGREQYDFTPDNGSVSATRVFICEWGNRGTLVNALKRTGHPNILFCYAFDFGIEPLGKSTGANSWELAKVTVGYKSTDSEEEENEEDIKTISIETSAENIGLQNDGCQFETGDTPAEKKVDLDPQTFVIFTQINVTFPNRSSVNEPVWQGVINKVNSGSISFGGAGFYTWPAGHLLYQGYSINVRVTTEGTKYEVTHRFVGSQVDHRKEFNPHIGDWDKVKKKKSGKYKYEEGDFSVLS